MDIVVTTPKSKIKAAAQEAEEAKRTGGGYYFRIFKKSPNAIPGDRVFYVEDGYIRGFCVISYIKYMHREVCGTTEKGYGEGYYIYMDVKTWKWIKPIPMIGFQGFRYMEASKEIEIIGGWLDPKPFI